MTEFYGLDFNQFTVIEHPLVPRLEFSSGRSLSDWSVILSINPIWTEDSKRDMFSLQSSEDVDDTEWFKEIVEEFNTEVSQEKWSEFYNQCKDHVIKYYEKNIAEETDKLNKLKGVN